ncbi:unnamed protein product [Oncorhynchus mykiss]|uniref:Uncharacterized protein n=1 Tax=Oncorhynchus mykiss TaxID=8022 RepID=A0A060XN31_ONCMY|nr:unnamed protein product [Oncorhynchus mykiss]
MWSPLLHPVVWSSKVGHVIKPPATAVSLHATTACFMTDSVHGGFFDVGIKIEAINPLNLGNICLFLSPVLLDGYLMVDMDGTGDGSDWFCYHTIFHAILPKGYCQKHNIQLTPPPGYDWKTFNWAKYLEEKGTMAAHSVCVLQDGLSNGFTENIKLKAVDLMEPRLVCVATVRRSVGRLLLHLDLDGWEPDFDQWVAFQISTMWAGVRSQDTSSSHPLDQILSQETQAYGEK